MVKYLPRPEEYHKYYYIDIESDGLWPDKLWCMCVSRLDETEVREYVGHAEIKSFFNLLRGQEVYFVGHNIVSYDAVHTKRLAGGFADVTNCVDTLVLSYLYDPRMFGGHSLEAWGLRLKDPKGDYNDWSRYTPEMGQYCAQDVRLGKKVFKALVQRMLRAGYTETSCEIEHQIRDVVNDQERNGWYFNIPGAQALASKLRAEQLDLEGPIRELFPPRLKDHGTYTRRYRRDGTDYESYARHRREFPELRDNGDGTYTTRMWEEFNIGSPKQRLERLLELGWEPVQFNELTDAAKARGDKQGTPKVDEDSLVAYAELSGLPAVKAIADWLVLQGRSSMIDTWLSNVNYDDSCMHGRVMTCAAATRRMTHNSPNTANIPKAKKKVKYGYESRSLWGVRPGRIEVGADASGLEMRMFAEYLANDEATLLFTTGDPHIVNTRNLGLPDEMRDLTVKNGFYAYLYGAGDPKLGKTLRPELQGREAGVYGKWARGVLEKGTPGLASLVAVIEDEFNHMGGVLKTIDGGYVRCHSRSAALNYKLQSAGAIVMKKAAIILRDKIRQEGWDALMVGNIHDEFQLDCHPSCADLVGSAAVQSITDAGVALGFRVPLTGEYKTGANWAECH